MGCTYQPKKAHLITAKHYFTTVEILDQRPFEILQPQDK